MHLAMFIIIFMMKEFYYGMFSPTLWYHRFYDILYSCAISTNFRCQFLNFTTAVPIKPDIIHVLLIDIQIFL